MYMDIHKNNVMVIDGNSLINRAFYGLQGRGGMLSSADGTPTNAVYGFLNIMLKQLEDVAPEFLCVAFDLRAPTFRHKAYSEYKAGRKGMPEDLAVQMPILKEMLAAMNIATYSLEGYEADDIIGTIARISEETGKSCYIITGDRDSLQLVSDKTCVRLLTTKEGCTPMYPAEIDEKYGVTPAQLIEVKALMGDSSDNIPGVKGVGEKTALELIQTYGTLESVYEHIDDITKKALKQKLIDDRDMAFLSRELGTIMREVPGLDSLDPFARKEADNDKLYNLCSKYGFKKLITRLGLRPASGGNAQTTLFDMEGAGENCASDNSGNDQTEWPEQRFTVTDRFGLHEMSEQLMSSDRIFLYTEVDVRKGEADLKRIGISDEKRLYGIDTGANDISLSQDDIANELRPLLESESVHIVGFDIKNFVFWALAYDIEVKSITDDLAIAAYVINPSGSNYSLYELLTAYTDVSEERQDPGENAFLMTQLIGPLTKSLEEMDEISLYRDVEIPLISVLADMEHTGFMIDMDSLRGFGGELSERIEQSEREIYEQAGEEFNINSPKQLGVILFEKLKLPAIRKTKTGYSTNAAVLEELRTFHPIIDMILEYRSITKLKSTYADGLLAAVNPDTGRLHSHFQQMVTATGRLSSTEPNLQNIPVRQEMGREIRKLFVADDGNILVDADYSQIELRVLSHMADDSAMQNAFRNNVDIHTSTASEVFGVPIDEVTPQLRSNAKAVNFGIVYGIGAFSLSKDLGISRADADKYIKDYLRTYSGVDAFMKRSVEEAKEKGYATTMLGRRRYIPEITASNFMTRSFGERVAMNAPVQGSAADIIKVAMIKVFNELKDNGLKAKLILQVHDELIVEAPEEERQRVEDILTGCMESAVEMKVPLIAEANSGRTWYETK